MAEVATAAAEPVAPARRGIRGRLPRERFLMFAAAAVVPAVVVGLVAIVLWSSFVDSLPSGQVVYTLGHYVAVYADAFTYRALANTLIFAVVTVVVAFLFGVPIAWLAERSDLPGKPLLYALMMIGVIIPTFFVAMGWMLLLHPRIGFVNIWLQRLTGDPGVALSVANIWGMGAVEGLSLAPLAFIMTASAFRAMNPVLEEAAEVHGMSRFQMFRRVTLPLMAPSLMAAAIFVFVVGIAAFDVPAVIGLANRVYTFSTLIYVKTLNPESTPQYGIPAAVGTMMFFLAVLVTWWYSRFIRHSERYAVVTGRGYRPQPVPLGRWRHAGWGFCAFYLLLAIGLPLLLVVWASLSEFLQPPSLQALERLSFRQFERLDWSMILRATTNTALLMLVVPTVSIVLAVPVAWVVVRSASRWRFAYEFLVFLPHAMPAIVLGVAALIGALFVLGDIIPIYGTVWLIAVVYVVERMTLCSRVLNSALMQVHREIEEAGYVSGMSIRSVMMRIFVPIVLPAIMAIWLWTALVTYRELTVAAVLFNPQSVTLPIVVWNLWTAGGMGAAAAVTLVMLAVFMPLVLIYWYATGRRSMAM
ncbi:MAG: ABC transporter permease [Rhodospirillales bacterium]